MSQHVFNLHSKKLNSDEVAFHSGTFEWSHFISVVKALIYPNISWIQTLPVVG